jgi:hypothetical protein
MTSQKFGLRPQAGPSHMETLCKGVTLACSREEEVVRDRDPLSNAVP